MKTTLSSSPLSFIGGRIEEGEEEGKAWMGRESKGGREGGSDHTKSNEREIESGGRKRPCFPYNISK
jgi:hypothetical protein